MRIMGNNRILKYFIKFEDPLTISTIEGWHFFRDEKAMLYRLKMHCLVQTDKAMFLKQRRAAFEVRDQTR